MQPLLYHVSKLYNLSITSVEPVEGGFLTNNQRIITSGISYFLKQYRSNNADEIKEIHSVKLFFAENNIPVVLPIKNKEGESFFIFDNRCYALFPFITDAMSVARKDLKDAHITSLGNMLARMHLLSKNEYPQVTTKTAKSINTEKFFEVSQEILDIISEKETKNGFDELALRAITFKRSALRLNTLKLEDLGLIHNHLTHGDYHDQNVFFDESGNVKYIYDFEKAVISARVKEIVRSMNLIIFDTTFTDENYARAKLYLQAYAAVYPITKEELEKGIRYMHLENLHSLWVEQEHYFKFNTRVDHFLQNGLDRITYINENFDTHLQRLLDCV